MIKLSDQAIKVYGRPNFSCAQMAKILINGGLYEDKESKAEYEQAVYIHWASGLLREHGEDWTKKGTAILKELIALGEAK